MAGRMGLLLSINTNQIVACTNQAGSIDIFSWSRFQTADAKVLFDVVCSHVLEHFKPKNPKYLQRKVLAKRSWQMGGMLLKTELLSRLQQWLLTADVKEMTVNSIGNARSM